MTERDPEQGHTPWYKSVPFRMALLIVFAIGFSWLLGVIVRFIAPF